MKMIGPQVFLLTKKHHGVHRVDIGRRRVRGVVVSAYMRNYNDKNTYRTTAMHMYRRCTQHTIYLMENG